MTHIFNDNEYNIKTKEIRYLIEQLEKNNITPDIQDIIKKINTTEAKNKYYAMARKQQKIILDYFKNRKEYIFHEIVNIIDTIIYLSEINQELINYISNRKIFHPFSISINYDVHKQELYILLALDNKKLNAIIEEYLIK